MTNLEYYVTHVFPAGFQSIRSTFRIWADLMGSNYAGYEILRDDDPEQECIEWFWTSLGDDDVYPKHFLEELIQLAEDVRTGKEKTYSLDEVMRELKEKTDGNV